ncbi:WecB/TagA/CpsF family glycosyltransferase [Neptuniibacter sp. QD34_54]|uniref:WecB/TagA/CpsF family glycosyltransferase n=1 Tax=Neptuniibacter sp. QD34_54 TaxID=3398208 RepID=UPI0039F4F2EA
MKDFEKLTEIASYVRKPIDNWEIVLSSALSDSKGLYVSFVNPLSLSIAKKDPEYINNLSKLDFVFSDGFLLANFVSRLTNEEVGRLSFDGNSLSPTIFSLLSKMLNNGERLKIAFIGGKDGIAAEASACISEVYSIQCVYTRNGFFKDPSEYDSLVSELIERDVDFVLVGMGAPYQEHLLSFLKESDWTGCAFTCGGYMDQIVNSGDKYYPDFINRYNLRAPYRLLKEPKRLTKRYLIDYMPFYFCSILGFFKNV